MRIVFAGTPDFAATALKALLTAGHDIVAVYTQPDRPAGRGRQLRPSPVKALALEAGIEVRQPENFREADTREALGQLQPDLMIVAAYGLILPASVLTIPKRGCLNIHASLLPRWRGAAPIQRAIAAGDRETGITIMQMDVGLDTGDMLLKLSTPISNDDTGQSLHDRLAGLGGEAIVTALARLDSLNPEPQDDSQACYARKLEKAEGRIDWADSAVVLDRLIRAFNPFPGTFTENDGKVLRIHASEMISGHAMPEPPGTVLQRTPEGADIACGAGCLRLTQVQLPGSRAQSVRDLINGGKPLLLPGQVLS